MDNQPFSNKTTRKLKGKLKNNADHSSSIKLLSMYCTNHRVVNMKYFSNARLTDTYYLPKWGLYGSVARIYLGVSSSSKRCVTEPGQFCRSIGCVSFSIPSNRLAILSFLKKM